MRETWAFLSSGAVEPALNMAWDEVLLEGAERYGRPVLRTYAWTVPAATFGYFQRQSEIEGLTSLRPLIRRPTGGGLVPHDADWTYSVVIPPGHPWHTRRAVDSYRAIHEWLQAAFGLLGLITDLAPGSDPTGPGQCFVGAERDDLLFRGRKIAGAAQRRNRWGLLIQGSVQPPPEAPAREPWEQALRTVRRGVDWVAFPTDGNLADGAEERARTKYRNPDYLGRR